MSILKRAVIILITIITTMLIIPLITANTVTSDAGMLVTLLLFFILNPIVSALVGLLSGKDARHFWFTPILVGILFWLFSSFTYQTAFPYVYSAIYFIICAVAMAVTFVLTKVLKK